jgi:hypothetical protein
MRKIAVFDTNILFSGVGWKGKPFLCLELARAGVVDGVTCRELLDELAEKLQSKLSFTPEQTLDTVADLLTFLRVVPITGTLKAIPADPERRQGPGMRSDRRGHTYHHRRPPAPAAVGDFSGNPHSDCGGFPRRGTCPMR